MPLEALSLAEMRAGQQGTIVGIKGGRNFIQKLDSLGIRIGEEITKVSAQWMKGPVMLKYGNTQIAVGFEMARKIRLEII